MEILRDNTLKSQTPSSIKSSLNELSLAERRKFNGSINITNIPRYSVSDQIANLDRELGAYKLQVIKLVLNIDKGLENFYSNESKGVITYK